MDIKRLACYRINNGDGNSVQIKGNQSFNKLQENYSLVYGGYKYNSLPNITELVPSWSHDSYYEVRSFEEDYYIDYIDLSNVVQSDVFLVPSGGINSLHISYQSHARHYSDPKYHEDIYIPCFRGNRRLKLKTYSRYFFEDMDISTDDYYVGLAFSSRMPDEDFTNCICDNIKSIYNLFGGN